MYRLTKEEEKELKAYKNVIITEIDKLAPEEIKERKTWFNITVVYCIGLIIGLMFNNYWFVFGAISIGCLVGIMISVYLTKYYEDMAYLKFFRKNVTVW